MNKIYYIGGSPCSGKSSITEMMVSKYGFKYFKVDDKLDDYTKRGYEDGKPLLSMIYKMTLDELWLRNPILLKDQEIEIYCEMFDYILEDINKIDCNVPIIAEGAAFLPKLMNKIGVDKTNYICVVPTEKFQYDQYSLREWVSYYLSGCSNKDLAFDNWMKRDSLFALEVLKDAKNLGYETLVVDGKKSIEDNFLIIQNLFNLSK